MSTVTACSANGSTLTTRSLSRSRPGSKPEKNFKAADFNNDKELTLEELREIEGDMADQVMREADVDNSGLLSKREYVDYKIRQAAHGALTMR
mmetsp:Transcript_81851/g.222138  ORF Transcript_81851/g.222138 Transcript_81851/m.222138 type:complete len:93 (-) Transcript_81851:82-360(-)